MATPIPSSLAYKSHKTVAKNWWQTRRALLSLSLYGEKYPTLIPSSSGHKTGVYRCEGVSFVGGGEGANVFFPHARFLDAKEENTNTQTNKVVHSAILYHTGTCYMIRRASK